MLVIELDERDNGTSNRNMHKANLVYQRTLYPDTRINIIKNRWSSDRGLVNKSVFMKVIKNVDVESLIEVMVRGETYFMESGRSYTWYIENNPTILTRKADGKKFYYVNRKFYDSEADYIFHTSILANQ